MREASTFRVDSRVQNYSLDLQDERLLAKLSAGHMVAQDAKYQPRCLVTLYNKDATMQDRSDKANSKLKVNQGIALAELLTYKYIMTTQELKMLLCSSLLISSNSIQIVLNNLGLNKMFGHTAPS